MDNKKHIDRLFQEKFKDFEATPDSKVWESIKNEIAPKKKKEERVIPIWFKYAGIAALLLLFITVGINTFKSTSVNTTIVDTNTPIKSKETKSSNTSVNSNTSVVSTDNNNENTNDASKTISNANEIEAGNTINQTSVASASAVKAKTKKTATGVKKNTNIPVSNKGNNDAMVSTVTKKRNNSSIDQIQSKSNSTKQENNGLKNATIAASPTTNGVAIISNSSVHKTSNKEKEINTAIDAIKDDTFSTTVAKSSNKSEVKKTLKDAVANNNNATPETEAAVAETKTVKDSIVTKNAIETVVAEAEAEAKTVKDSIATKNAIEAVVAEAKNKSEKEKKKEEDAVSNKWTVNANAAPVYYNTLGKGSHIDQQFVDNEKKGAITTSYGINVGYAINDKLKIRSGVNSLNLAYDTANVLVYESLTASNSNPNALNNLEIASFDTSGVRIAVLSAETIDVNQFESFMADDDFKTADLKQQINYVEIPVELEYALVNKRFGVNVIGGMSTFILGENEVSAEVSGVTTTIGEVNNINATSFSTNIGLGMDYDFTKSIKINLEPTFKYQLNAFDDTAGNFNPFILGVYTGLSFNF